MPESPKGAAAPDLANPDYIPAHEAAKYWHMTPEALAVARCRRVSHLPQAYKFGRRVFYRRDEVLASIKPTT